jgi:hypothetical protein|tara:strand:+ start:371 stop:553 length:183 start_codon:yes stop_codon:yes gene_type:complete
MTRKVTISCDKISPKQWSVLLVELNLIKDAWKPFAPLKIEAPDFEKIIRWGQRKYHEKEE